MKRSIISEAAKYLKQGLNESVDMSKTEVASLAKAAAKNSDFARTLKELDKELKNGDYEGLLDAIESEDYSVEKGKLPEKSEFDKYILVTDYDLSNYLEAKFNSDAKAKLKAFKDALAEYQSGFVRISDEVENLDYYKI